jgi:hypothetical protein
MLGVTSDNLLSSSAPSSDVQIARPLPSPPKALRRRLELLQRSLRGIVLGYPVEQQGELVSVVVQWASRLKLDPLASLEDFDEDPMDCESTMMDGRDNVNLQEIGILTAHANGLQSRLGDNSTFQPASEATDGTMLSAEV